MNKVKQFIKQILKFLHIDLTLNMKYDRQTSAVFKKLLKPDSNCVDIGCHKGEILEEFLNTSPNGIHYAFEPIPSMYNDLKKKFHQKNVHIYPFALAESSGNTTFNFVKNAPAYSGIKERKYAIENPEIEKINVELKPLDEIIPQDHKVHLIKIDVEGAELGVLKGGKKTILQNKPVIIFECGLGASDYYGTKPEDIYTFLTNETQLKISTMKNWLNNQKELSLKEFSDKYHNGTDYYFIAYN